MKPNQQKHFTVDTATSLMELAQWLSAYTLIAQFVSTTCLRCIYVTKPERVGVLIYPVCSTFIIQRFFFCICIFIIIRRYFVFQKPARARRIKCAQMLRIRYDARLVRP